MQPLGKAYGQTGQRDRNVSDISEDLLRADEPSIAIPLFIRRMIRTVRNLDLVRFFSDRKLAFSAGIVAAITGVFAFSGNDQPLGIAMASVSQKAGLSVSKLVVDGNLQLEDDALKAELSDVLGSSMLGLDVDVAREAIARNNWVKAATVKKAYPDTLVVEIVERQPVALWKSANELMLISSDGIAIDKAEVQHMHLPQVVGEGANKVASEFLTAISRFPELAGRADAYVRIASRRWDLVLDDGMRVLLPANGWRESLTELNELHLKRQVLDREIVQIDMRLRDRLTFRLEPDAAEARRTNIETLMKRDWHRT